jgi:hypothetical protein
MASMSRAKPPHAPTELADTLTGAALINGWH